MKLPKKRQYPNTLRFGTEEFKVKFVRTVPDEKKDEHLYGLFDPEAKTIYIKQGMSEMETFLTWVHEGIHAIEDVYDIELTESTVHKLEKGIVELFINNPFKV